ncbi:hypothetical protein [Zhihengliuella sp. ISTPL4]|uniref:hypothetical protein n=1 Tax=Zhihengliuella sp. ISTPL4 TaxID=2058657 RepID=UPI002570AFD9|nr:hypothetical protein [Zhihengliuella sp. ISTPL4]
MSTLRDHPVLAVGAATALLLLTGCATAPGGSAPPTSTTVPSDMRLEEAEPAPPEGSVVGTGTVLDSSGDAELCLGAIQESYPPQCDGVPLDEWSWDGVDGSEASGDTRWGAYAVTGTWDGERFTVTEPPALLALYDPMVPEDPTDGVEGTRTAQELDRVQDDIVGRLGAAALSVSADRGYVWLQVVWDDGTMQDALDAEYGDDVVVVTSALREVDGN